MVTAFECLLRPGGMRVLIAFALVAVAACSDTKKAEESAHPGKVVFQQQCALCHALDGSRSQGPSLNGIVGRPAATVAGFQYTKAMRESGLTWDKATLNAFLENPMGKVPGSMMVTAVKDPMQRAAVIEFLDSTKAQ